MDGQIATSRSRTVEFTLQTVGSEALRAVAGERAQSVTFPGDCRDRLWQRYPRPGGSALTKLLGQSGG